MVKKAQLGDKQCMERLTELAEKRLRIDVYRLTLQAELTQEIIQETLFEMFKVLKDLEDARRFWPWLYKIALNKVRLHHRNEQRRKTVPLSAVPDAGTPRNGQEAMAGAITQEVKEIVFAAMRALKPRHRAVLTMRCYREMAYSDIAESMGCSEFAAKMLFYRAKQALRKELSRNGLGKASLMTALLLFGKMTAPAEAAEVSVTAAATKVGLLAGMVGLVTSKTAIVSLGTASVLAVGTIVATSRPEKGVVGSGPDLVAGPGIVSPFGESTNGAEEYWYYFPEGPGRPMMMRGRYHASDDRSYCQVLQNDQANYYYQGNTIYINNHRMYAGNLSVLRLPTDGPALSSFLSQVQGNGAKMPYVPNKNKGLLIVAARDENQGSPQDALRRNHAWVTRHYNVLEEDYFRYDWPATVKTVDNRDTMHRRGWTYFRITGQINGEKVAGKGRIPFVYAMSKQHGPWLDLRIGDKLRVVDDETGACVYGADGRILARYDGGSFFRGLARPWMGMHTIDTVRRDAAEQSVSFETRHTPGTGKVAVELDCEQVRLTYTIDLEADVVEEIAFSAGDAGIGRLSFSYLQSISGLGNEFAKPRIQTYRGPRKDSKGLLWLAQLAGGSLTK